MSAPTPAAPSPLGIPILGRAVYIRFAGWAPAVSRGVLALEKSPFFERDVFPRVTRSILENRQKLIRTAQLSETGIRTGGLQNDFPLAVTLGMFKDDSVSPASITLLALALDLELCEPCNNDTRLLASVVRGLWNTGKRSEFAFEVARVSGMHSLLVTLDTLNRAGQSHLHKTLFEAWTNSLRKEAVSRLRDAADGHNSTTRTSVSNSGEAFDVLFATSEVDDDPAEFISVPELTADEQFSPRVQIGLAKYHELARRSSISIFRRPDDILPASLAQAFAARALEALRCAVAASAEDAQVARLVAVNLLVAVGLSESDCRNAFFASNPFADRVAIDPDRSCIYRPEARPVASATPEASDCRWLPTGGPVALAIPTDLASCILAWRRNAEVCAPLMQDELSTSGWLSSAIREVDATFPAGWRVFRERIGSAIGEKLGFEAAQISFGDSFALSTGAAYYSRYPAQNIAEVAWEATAALYGTAGTHLPASFVPPAHCVGSRIAPDPKLLKEMTSRLTRDFRSAIRVRGAPSTNDWARVRDYVALVLMAATGHRPTAALAELRLSSFVLHHALVVLQDKRVDPSHLTRIAALGTGCCQLVCTYVRCLQRIACSADHPGSGLATRILNSEEALFTTANGSGESVPLVVSTLLSRAGSLVAERPNVLRHVLNQALIERNVDPEIRHQQLGWLLVDASTTSDCSPRAPTDFAKEIGPEIDKILINQGWEIHCTQIEIPELPLPVLADWRAATEQQTAEKRRAVAQLQRAWREQRHDKLKLIAPKLHSAITLLMPWLQIEKGPKRDRLTSARDERTAPVTARDVDSVIRLALRGDDDPVSEIAVRSELARLLREFRARTGCPTHVPSVPRLSKSTEPSPFLPAAGIACRQIEWLRAAVLEEPSRWVGPRKAEIRAALGILLCSPVVSHSDGLALVAHASGCARSHDSGEIVRTAFGGDSGRHCALTGIAAAFVAASARHGKARRWGTSDFGNVLRSAVPELFAADQDSEDVVARLESTLRVGRAFDLSGIERCSLFSGLPTKTVEISRAIGVEDNWPCSPVVVETREAVPKAPASLQPHPLPSGSAEQRETRQSGGSLLRVLSIFQKGYRGKLKLTAKVITDATRNRRALIRHEIATAANTVASRHDAAALIVRYAHHLSVHGGRRKKSGLRQNTIYTMLRRFATPLNELTRDADMTRLSEGEMEALYCQVVLCHRERSRRRSFDALRGFHQFLVDSCGVPQLQWAEIRRVAGARMRSSNPGLLSRSEIREMWTALLQDCTAAEKMANTAPEELHVRRLRMFSLAILDGAGIRPDSLYGLVFADIRLTPSGDYVHLHRWGGYGAAKTDTSLGFIPLDGPDWSERRQWVKTFIEARVAALNGRDSLPVFGALSDPSERVRRHLIERRIGELARWASGERKAEPYWLRKTCIHHRYVRLLRVAPAQHAREIYRVLRQCGHVRIDTALECYLADPALHTHRHLRADTLVSLRTLADVTGVAPGTIQQRMQRATAESVRDLGPQRRMTIALDCLKVPFARQTRAAVAPPPPCPPIRQAVGVRDTEQLVRDFIVGRSERVATERGNFSELGTHKIYARCRLFSAITGWSLGKTIAPPRPIRSAERVRKLLDGGDDLVPKIAGDWVLVAGRAGPGVLALPDERSRDDVLTLLGRIGCESDVRSSGLLFIFENLREKNSSIQRHTGLWPTLRWVLTIAWVHLGWDQID